MTHGLKDSGFSISDIASNNYIINAADLNQLYNIVRRGTFNRIIIIVPNDVGCKLSFVLDARHQEINNV